MDEILHHQRNHGMIIPLRISTTNGFPWFQSAAGFRPSTVLPGFMGYSLYVVLSHGFMQGHIGKGSISFLTVLPEPNVNGHGTLLGASQRLLPGMARAANSGVPETRRTQTPRANTLSPIRLSIACAPFEEHGSTLFLNITEAWTGRFPTKKYGSVFV